MIITELQALVVASEAQPMRVWWELFPSCIQIAAGPAGGRWRHIERVMWPHVSLPSLHETMSIAVDRAIAEEAAASGVRVFPVARPSLRSIDGGKA